MLDFELKADENRLMQRNNFVFQRDHLLFFEVAIKIGNKNLYKEKKLPRDRNTDK